MFSAAKRLWSELRRRRVLKTTVAYIVGAWIIVEASSVLFPVLLLPEWSVRIVVAIAVLALPLIVVLAWTFDIERKADSRLGAVIVGTDDRDRKERESTGTPPLLESAIASIAVLPFKTAAAGTDYDYVADGLATELHGVLAKVHRLRVAARTSTFAYRDSPGNVREIARKLNVQYIVSGDVHCVDDRIHAHICLDNAVDGMQIWSESYDREFSDIFSVQKDIAQAVAGAFGGARLREEIVNAAEQPTDDPNAWSLVQRARAFVLGFTPQALADAVPLLRKAIKLDADYAAAHAALSFVLAEQVLNGLAKDLDDSRSQALDHAERAQMLAPTDPFVLKNCGAVWAYFGALDQSLEALRRAVRIAQFDFGAWGYLGWPLASTGKDSDLSELHTIMERILEGSPTHPGAPYWLYHRSVACSCSSDVEDAVSFASQSVERNPAFPWGLLQYANALGTVGDTDAATRVVEQSLKLSPALTVAHYEAMVEKMSALPEVAGRRLAGLTVGRRT